MIGLFVIPLSVISGCLRINTLWYLILAGKSKIHFSVITFLSYCDVILSTFFFTGTWIFVSFVLLYTILSPSPIYIGIAVWMGILLICKVIIILFLIIYSLFFVVDGINTKEPKLRYYWLSCLVHGCFFGSLLSYIFINFHRKEGLKACEVAPFQQKSKANDVVLTDVNIDHRQNRPNLYGMEKSLHRSATIDLVDFKTLVFVAKN